MSELRTLLREKCVTHLKRSNQKHDGTHVDEALELALARVDRALDDVAALAVAPIARRLEQAAVDAAGLLQVQK